LHGWEYVHSNFIHGARNNHGVSRRYCLFGGSELARGGTGRVRHVPGIWTLPASFKTSCSQEQGNWRLGASLATHSRRVIPVRFKGSRTSVLMAIREFE